MYIFATWISSVAFLQTIAFMPHFRFKLIIHYLHYILFYFNFHIYLLLRFLFTVIAVLFYQLQLHRCLSLCALTATCLVQAFTNFYLSMIVLLPYIYIYIYIYVYALLVTMQDTQQSTLFGCFPYLVSPCVLEGCACKYRFSSTVKQ
jgi:hypothetical protein